MIPGSRALTVRASDGTGLHTRIFGPSDAPPVVLAHGILCSTEFWQPQIDALSRDYRVIAFDHRGHGRSQAPRAGHYSLDHLADDLDSVLTATVADGEKAVLAGHSMGGIAILAWSERHRDQVADRIAAAALVNTTPGDVLRHVDFLRVPPHWEAIRRRLARWGALLSRIPLPQRMLPFRRALLAHLAVGPSASRETTRTVDAILAATSPRGRSGYGLTMVDFTHTLDVTALDVPTAVIAGTHDRLTPLPRARQLAAALPQLTRLIELPCGHCGPLENPGEVTAALQALGRATHSVTA